jgi:hypothetical protein
MQSRWANASWLVATGAIALCATGLSLPHIRDLLDRWSGNLWGRVGSTFVQ